MRLNNTIFTWSLHILYMESACPYSSLLHIVQTSSNRGDPFLLLKSSITTNFLIYFSLFYLIVLV
uniref:Putative ovule protein n=1 Tax=Solanum chacoense TaxID=4108 RepID=A0A0V0I798_SOLCH